MCNTYIHILLCLRLKTESGDGYCYHIMISFTYNTCIYVLLRRMICKKSRVLCIYVFYDQVYLFHRRMTFCMIPSILFNNLSHAIYVHISWSPYVPCASTVYNSVYVTYRIHVSECGWV